MLTLIVCGVTAAAAPEPAPKTAPGIAAASNSMATKPAPTADFLYIRLLPKPPRRLNFPNPVIGTESADRRRRSGSRPAYRVALVPAAPGALPGWQISSCGGAFGRDRHPFRPGPRPRSGRRPGAEPAPYAESGRGR